VQAAAAAASRPPPAAARSSLRFARPQDWLLLKVWSLLSELGHLSRLTSLTADVLRDRSGLRQLASSAPGLSGLRSLSLTVRGLAGDAAAEAPTFVAADLLFLSRLTALSDLSIADAVVLPAALPPLLFLTRLDISSTRLTPAIASTLPAGLLDLSFGLWSGTDDVVVVVEDSSSDEESGSDDDEVVFEEDGGGGAGGGGAAADPGAGGGDVGPAGGAGGGNVGPAGGAGGGGGDAPPAPAPCASVTRLSCTSVPEDLRALMTALPSVTCARLKVVNAGIFHPPPSRAAGWRLRSLEIDAFPAARASVGAELVRLLGDPGGLRELRVIDGGGVDLAALLAAAPQLRRLCLEADFVKATTLEACTAPLPLQWLRLRCSQWAAGLSVRGLLALGRAAPGLTRLQLSDGYPDDEFEMAGGLEDLPPQSPQSPPLPAGAEEACDGLFTVREGGPLLPALRHALLRGAVAPTGA